MLAGSGRRWRVRLTGCFESSWAECGFLGRGSTLWHGLCVRLLLARADRGFLSVHGGIAEPLGVCLVTATFFLSRLSRVLARLLRVGCSSTGRARFFGQPVTRTVPRACGFGSMASRRRPCLRCAGRWARLARRRVRSVGRASASEPVLCAVRARSTGRAFAGEGRCVRSSSRAKGRFVCALVSACSRGLLRGAVRLCARRTGVVFLSGAVTAECSRGAGFAFFGFGV